MIKAVIFDMDGVVIDTTGFWADAEREVFGNIDVKVTDELAAQTAGMSTGMSTTQVTEFWFEKFPWENPGKAVVEQRVVERVGEYIDSRGQAIDGVVVLLATFRRAGLKVGLATNSPKVLVRKVLQRLDLEDAFHAVVTFDDVVRAKPDPEIYLKCLNVLGVSPKEAAIVEDSDTGVEAGIASGCKVFHLCPDADLSSLQTSSEIYPVANLRTIAHHLQTL